MKYAVFAMTIFALLLAGCTADSTPIPPTPVVTPNTPPQEVPVDLSGIAPGEFRVKYTDPTTGQFTTLSGTASYSPVLNATSGFTLNLTKPNAESTDPFVIFALPEDITPGTYHIIEYNAAYSDDNRTVLTVGATLAGAANYFETHEGALTIQTVNPLTGAFHFSGIAELDETHTVQVVVDGALNAVPFIEVRPGK